MNLAQWKKAVIAAQGKGITFKTGGTIADPIANSAFDSEGDCVAVYEGPTNFWIEGDEDFPNLG
jgi:hypothetical protein